MLRPVLAAALVVQCWWTASLVPPLLTTGLVQETVRWLIIGSWLMAAAPAVIAGRRVPAAVFAYALTSGWCLRSWEEPPENPALMVAVLAAAACVAAFAGRRGRATRARWAKLLSGVIEDNTADLDTDVVDGVAS